MAFTRLKFFIWKHRFVIPLILLPLLIQLIWFRDGRIIGGGDEIVLFFDSTISLELSTSTWMKYGTGFAVISWLSRSTIFYLIHFLNTILHIPGLILQIVTFYLLMVTGIVSMYYLVRYFLSTYFYKEYVAVLAAFFYLMNPYTMSQVWGRGQYAQFFSFAWLPMALLLFTIGIKSRKYKYTIVFTLISILFSSAYGFLTFSIAQWSVLVLFVLYELISKYKKNGLDFFGIYFFLLSLGMWILAHAWWILPLILSGPAILGVNIQSRENIGSLVGVSQSYPFPILIRLLQTFYFFSDHAYSAHYHITRFQLISWIPVIGLVIGIFAVFRSKVFSQAKFFLIIFIVGIFVSLGANPPFGSIFIFILERIPLLQIFRNPYEKYGLVYVLGYAPLFAIGVITSLEFLSNRVHIRKVYALIIGILLVILLNIYLWPMWTGKIVAGSEDKIGVSFPNYLNDYRSWLEKNNDNYRVFMTPLWRGEGSIYSWNGTRYQGVDPYIFLTPQEEVGSSARSPYYYDFAQSLLQYMPQIDTRPATQLLRVKYLVNRKDVALITQSEKEQYKYLSERIYPLSSQGKPVTCEASEEGTPGVADTFTCKIPSDNQDWQSMKYLSLLVNVDSRSTLNAGIVDNADNRKYWDGRGMASYQLESGSNNITLPLYAPTSENAVFNTAHVTRIEITAHPFLKPGEKVHSITATAIRLNEGEQKRINEFKPLTHFGELDIYEPTNLITPPEFGILTENKLVTNHFDLFSKAYEDREKLDSTGYLMTTQNPGKTVKNVVKKSAAKVAERAKISETRYWLKAAGDTDAYVILSKTYYPGWKIIQGVDKDVLNGSIFNNIRLITSPSKSETEHYVVNGYANLWKVAGNDKSYAVIFLPQLIADIGAQISILSVIIILGIMIWYQTKKIRIKRK